MNILHISDLHFGEYFVPEVSEALLTQITTLKIDAIVISGDLTQRAKPHEFTAVRDFLQQLPDLPKVVVPGNHDVPLYRVWERLFSPYALYQRHISKQRDSVLHTEQAVIVGLDSTDPYRSIVNGRLSREQLSFCQQALQDVSDEQLRIVVMHHHLVPAPTFEQIPPMPKAKRALEMLTQLRVDMVLAGHLHRAYVGHSLDVYSGEDRDHGIVVVQCGTTTSGRGRGLEREKNSLNLIKFGDQVICVDHYHYIEEQQQFAAISRHEFLRPHTSPTTQDLPESLT